jgi:hypothetical protein
VPLSITASDKYGNSIGQTVESYTISVESSGGYINNGATNETSMQINNFFTTNLIYQAPTGITANKGIKISIAPTPEEKLLTKSVIGTPTAIKSMTVAKGVVTVFQDPNILYQTAGKQILQPKLTFNLPKDESDIQYKDTDDIPQIHPDKIPSLRITVKDKNGNRLATVASITSKQ